jgi:S-adenosylmethionine:tRNA ribosyltransferase-isomerase
MIGAATWPRQAADKAKIVRVSASEMTVGTHDDLTQWLSAGDVLVLNDAAVIPAAVELYTPEQERVEVRLLEAPTEDHARCRAIVFGAGDWRLPTEARTQTRRLNVGEWLNRGELRLRVEAIDPAHPRWVTVQFDHSLADTLRLLYELAAPIQYSYVREPLALWHVQTPMATRPVAVEAPSSGYLLRWGVLRRLHQRGVQLTVLTHATGLSSTGEPSLDARLPIDERYEIPDKTVEIVSLALAQGRRVIAVGTGVMRALEANAQTFGALTAGQHIAHLKLGPNTQSRVCAGVLTGVHEEGSSHARLLESLFSAEQIRRALEFCDLHALKGHEFGDGTLWL